MEIQIVRMIHQKRGGELFCIWKVNDEKKYYFFYWNC